MRARLIVILVGLALLAAVPPLAKLLNEPFYVDLLRRVMIFAIAAVSLNLILGYGGMVSFGHAAYLGVGAYAVAILAFHGVTSGWVQWGVAIGASAAVALVIGAISIRTSGIYFIMITLAFTQMLYYLAISLDDYGGDDGMRLAKRSDFGDWLDLSSPAVFYYFVLAILVLFVWITHRLVESRFGMVIRAAKSNEARTRAIGLSPYLYRLTAFVLAGAMCGVWTRSGELMFMVILGGIGTLTGPVLGAFVLLMLEDLLSGWTVHWQLFLGAFLVFIVLYARKGLAGLLPGGRRDG